MTLTTEPLSGRSRAVSRGVVNSDVTGSARPPREGAEATSGPPRFPCAAVERPEGVRSEVRYPKVYVWGNNAKRAALKGRRCRVLAAGQMRSVLIEFEGGQREIVSRRALRRP